MGVRGGDRRYDYLKHAIDYGRELTPGDNRRRLRAERNGEVVTPGSSRSSLPGEAPNAGFSQVAEANQHPRVSKREPVL